MGRCRNLFGWLGEEQAPGPFVVDRPDARPAQPVEDFEAAPEQLSGHPAGALDDVPTIVCLERVGQPDKRGVVPVRVALDIGAVWDIGVRRVGLEQHPANVLSVGTGQRAELRDPGHHRWTVEGHHAGRADRGQDRRRVRVAHHDLRVGGDRCQVQMREQPDRIVATDRAEDRPDRPVGEGRVEIGGAPSWVGGQAGCRRPGRGVLPDVQAPPAENRQAVIEDVREGSRTGPRRRDDRDRVAGNESPGPNWTAELHRGRW